MERKIKKYRDALEDFFTADDGDTLRASDFNRRIINSAPISIMVIDKNGVIVYINKYFKNLSSSDSPLYKSVFQTPFFIKENLSSAYKKLLESGKVFKKENIYAINSQGQERYFNIIATPLKDKNGNIDGALSLGVDVTELAQIKIKTSQTNDELRRKLFEKAAQLQKVNKDLEKSSVLKSQFISDASHELRTPLSIAKLNLEFLKKQIAKKDKALTTNISSVEDEIDKVSAILSEMEFFTAIDENSVDGVVSKKLDLSNLIENVVVRLKTLAKTKKIDLLFEGGNLKEIMGDRSKLERVFTNIIGNSIKYGKKGGWVKIQFESGHNPKNQIKIIISDNGVGIAKEDLPYIFERFYRSKTAKKTGEGGFGLGLAVSEWIIKHHGGSILVSSKAGKGTVFTIALPK